MTIGLLSNKSQGWEFPKFDGYYTNYANCETHTGHTIYLNNWNGKFNPLF